MLYLTNSQQAASDSPDSEGEVWLCVSARKERISSWRLDEIEFPGQISLSSPEGVLFAGKRDEESGVDLARALANGTESWTRGGGDKGKCVWDFYFIVRHYNT